MAGNFCSHCGNAVSPMAVACPQCGHPVVSQQTTGQPLANPYAPAKSRVTAGILGILLGGLGVHKFYLGKVGPGVVHLLIFVIFFWTLIPTIVGLVEGIIYLTQSDQDFANKQGVRVV